MKNGYKKLITERIKDSINQWIDDLKSKQPDLLLTKQWHIIFPKGFQAGFNCLPVVTGSKQGNYLIAEAQFVLPTDLELDINSIELALKNEPYQEPKSENKTTKKPVLLDEPIDLLNDLVIGVNQFLQSLNISIPGSAPIPSMFPTGQQTTLTVNPLMASKDYAPHLSIISNDTNIIDRVKKSMTASPYFPEWMSTIPVKDVFDELLDKLAQGFVHYERQMGRSIELREFFDMYTNHLKQSNKLYHYCKYKAKPVDIDDNGYCREEGYCSKKPFQSRCSLVTLKFGNPP